MRLNSSSIIAGRPVLEIRDLFRNCNHSMSAEYVKNRLNTSFNDAKNIIDCLQKDEYLAKSKYKNIDGEEKFYLVPTKKGNALAMASTARPVKRATAEKAVQKFLERVVGLNANENYSLKVKRALVFGSYLTEVKELGDVDIQVDLIRRKSNQERQTALEEQIRKGAVEQGRSFSTHYDYIFWPEVEVQRFLKNRSRTLSLHYTDRTFVEQGVHRVIFEDPTLAAVPELY